MKKLRLQNLITKFENLSVEKDSVNNIDCEGENTDLKKKTIFKVNTVKKYKSVMLQSDNNKSLNEDNNQSKIDIQTFQKNMLKTPLTRNSKMKISNPNKESKNLPFINKSKKLESPKKYYVTSLIKSLSNIQTSYFIRMYRYHFDQNLRAAYATRFLKIQSQGNIVLPKTSDKQKTVIFDLDQTLIHCSEGINFNTVRLHIPLETGQTVLAGINIRPHCRQLLKEISSIAEIIIFTASSSLYADVVLDYLDPQKKYISHRLYRQHCTFQKGFYIKDLRNLNRNLEDVVIVDNSYYSFCLQVENGIPVIPFYDNTRDKQLVGLIEYLKILLKEPNMRQFNRKYFLLDKYREADIRNQILNNID